MDVLDESWPYLVRLRFSNKKNMKKEDSFLCGGTVIHQNFVLTAAHCCVNKERFIYIFYIFIRNLELVTWFDLKYVVSWLDFGKIIFPQNQQNVRNLSDMVLPGRFRRRQRDVFCSANYHLHLFSAIEVNCPSWLNPKAINLMNQWRILESIISN